MNKKGFEFSFAWLFALLAGAAILFLAIYFAVKIVGTSRYQIDTTTAKQLSIIFEPMEVGLASGKSNVAGLREETRIFNKCYEEGSFGKHRISLTTKGFGKSWKKPGGDIPVTNKYIFSNSTEEGKIVYFFSKPFKMPWKVSEIIFLTTQKYCFENAPDEIKDEVLGLNLQNVKVDNCTNEIKVCFGSSGCEIRVTGLCNDYDCESEYDYGAVKKEGKTLTYSGSLIYGAIFSSPEIYECNVKRLMKRLVQQALIYNDESNFLTGKCGSSVNLIQLISMARALDKTQDLLVIRQIALEVNEQNENSECKLW